MVIGFIESIAPMVVEHSYTYNLPPSVCIAQACLESNYGTSELAVKANNVFGRKHRKGFEPYVKRTKEYLPDEDEATLVANGFEVLGDGWYAKPLPFIHYPSIEAGIIDYFWNIGEREIYRPAREALPDKAEYLKLLGAKYGTDGRYTKKVQGIIDREALYQFDSY